MRSIPLAITWEMFRRGGWGLLLGLLGANAIPIMLFTALRHDGAIEAGDPSMLLMQLTLLQMNVFTFGTAVLIAQGPVSRLYTYPIGTASLVACHMLLAAVLMGVQIVASSLAINFLFGLDWPLWGPALFAAVAVVAIQAVLWFSEKSAWLPWTVGAVSVILGLWLKSQYGPMFSEPTHSWTNVTPWDVAFLLIIAVLSYGIGILGVARNRCGEPIRSLGIVEWLGRAFDQNFDERLSFRTPQDAQFWFEWTKKGWVMPGGVLICLIGWLGMWLIFIRDTEVLVASFVVGGILLSGLAIVGGMLFGNTGPNDANFQVGHFRGTRPMTTVDMSRTILKAGALSVVTAWGIWFVAFACLLAILFFTQTAPLPAFHEGVTWWYLPATLLGFWTAFAVITSGTMMGEMKWWAPLFIGLVALGSSLSLASKFYLSPEAQMRLWHGVLAVGGVAFVLGTIWAYAKAYRGSLVDGTVVLGAMMAWIALTGVVLYEWAQHPLANFPVYLFVIGLMAAAVAPFAAAPLALSWNRNQ